MCSEWATPVVVIPKGDGKIKPCGDYKVSVNKSLEIDQYHLPRPDDLFIALTGGGKFLQLDLIQVYQQIILKGIGHQ